MSDEDAQFEEGVRRGAEGKASPYPLGIATMFDSRKSKEARQRGWETGVTIGALAKAGRESKSEGSPSPGAAASEVRTFAGTQMSGTALLLWSLFYLGLLVGAYHLVQVAATWSLVWWLCVLILVSGVPVFILVAIASLGAILVLSALAGVVALFGYFSGNLF